MNLNRYRLITPRDLENYANIANDIAGVSRPEFMLHDPIADEYWHELFDRFEEYQFALIDQGSNQMAAMGISNFSLPAVSTHSDQIIKVL